MGACLFQTENRTASDNGMVSIATENTVGMDLRGSAIHKRQQRIPTTEFIEHCNQCDGCKCAFFTPEKRDLVRQKNERMSLVRAALVGRDCYNPQECEQITRSIAEQSQQAASEAETMKGDLRDLVAWIDGAFRGYELIIEKGSRLDLICERWRDVC